MLFRSVTIHISGDGQPDSRACVRVLFVLFLAGREITIKGIGRFVDGNDDISLGRIIYGWFEAGIASGSRAASQRKEYIANELRV